MAEQESMWSQVHSVGKLLKSRWTVIYAASEGQLHHTGPDDSISQCSEFKWFSDNWCQSGASQDSVECSNRSLSGYNVRQRSAKKLEYF